MLFTIKQLQYLCCILLEYIMRIPEILETSLFTNIYDLSLLYFYISSFYNVIAQFKLYRSRL